MMDMEIKRAAVSSALGQERSTPRTSIFLRLTAATCVLLLSASRSAFVSAFQHFGSSPRYGSRDVTVVSAERLAFLTTPTTPAVLPAPWVGVGKSRRESTSLSSTTPEESTPATSKDSDEVKEVLEEAVAEVVDDSAEKEKVGNLVEDDEWMGLTIELAELLRCAVIEDVKKTTREFTGEDDYRIGDISKAIDSKVKDEVANLRNKDEYELGDLSAAMDKIAKDMTCELSGKEEYEFGDLSKEIDTRIKGTVETFTGKPYEAGDLTREVSKRVSSVVEEFTGKDYEFGDISREIEKRRATWVKNVIGKDDYEFGDLTKKAITSITGKDDYEFGDISKKLFKGVFGKRKRGGDDK